MTNTDYYFILGIVIAGAFGFLVSLILKNWKTVDNTQKQMFSKPPVPGVKTISGSENKGTWGIIAAPNKSPIRVLGNGCITIITQIIFLLGTIVLIGVLFYSSPLENLFNGILEGIIFASILGFILQNIRINWKKIAILYKKIVNAPDPMIPYLIPVRQGTVTTKPNAPAFTVVIQSAFEVLWRAIWVGILFFLLYFAFAEILPILREGIIQPTSASPFQL